LDWREEWHSVLKSAIDANPAAMAAVFLGEEPGGFCPFPGLYRSSLRGVAEEIWGAGGRSMREFHARIGGDIEKCRLTPNLRPKSFNTQAEWSQILKDRLS
jgi:molybdopterin-guanine dinucleotide biosynthesis protein A